MMRQKIVNGTLLTPYRAIQGRTIVIDNGQIIGVHEGPVEYEEILNHSSTIVRWSAAPELQGVIAFGQPLRQKGIIAAIAHTDALYDDVLTAYEDGYSLVTHLYSAMSGVTRRNAFRYAGVIDSALLPDRSAFAMWPP